MFDKFFRHLKLRDYSPSTIYTYKTALNQYYEKFGNKFTENNLILFKHYLMETTNPKTVNTKIHAINKYLTYIGKKELKLQGVAIQTQSFTDNVISKADYNFLKAQLKKDDKQGYFLVRLLCATGARVSEFVQIKIEHVRLGYLDIYGKGCKHRRIYIPARLRMEILKWVGDKQSGYLFINTKGNPFSVDLIKVKLRQYATKYNIDKKVMHPHSFRHRFAKNFVEKEKDIALLADLLGHCSIETTRIYLKRSSTEQQDLVDKIVTW
jgi:site-specific recombinase XerD